MLKEAADDMPQGVTIRFRNESMFNRSRLDNEVLQRAKINGIEAMLMRAQLRWVGHVQRMSVDRMPKQIFYSELFSGARSRGGKRKRYKDTLKQTLKMTGIDTETWHELAENRTGLRQAVKEGVRSFAD